MRSLDPQEFFATLLSHRGSALVVFVKPGCGACRALTAVLTRTDPAELGADVFLVDGEDGAGLVADYEIFEFPALFLWRDGEYHAAIHASPTTAALGRAIAEALAQPAEPEP